MRFACVAASTGVQRAHGCAQPIHAGMLAIGEVEQVARERVRVESIVGARHDGANLSAHGDAGKR
jgi:hypothetical protein